MMLKSTNAKQLKATWEHYLALFLFSESSFVRMFMSFMEI